MLLIVIVSSQEPLCRMLVNNRKINEKYVLRLKDKTFLARYHVNIFAILQQIKHQYVFPRLSRILDSGLKLKHGAVGF